MKDKINNLLLVSATILGTLGVVCLIGTRLIKLCVLIDDEDHDYDFEDDFNLDDMEEPMVLWIFIFV